MVIKSHCNNCLLPIGFFEDEKLNNETTPFDNINEEIDSQKNNKPDDFYDYDDEEDDDEDDDDVPGKDWPTCVKQKIQLAQFSHEFFAYDLCEKI